jgi:hypothetical protein
MNNWWTPALLLAILATAIAAHGSVWLAVNGVDQRVDRLETELANCTK